MADLAAQDRLRAVEAETGIFLAEATLAPVLRWMQGRCQSVSLTWGEDNGLWECSWVTGGQRHTGVSKEALLAVCEAILKAVAPAALENGPPQVKATRESGLPFYAWNCPACGAGNTRQTLGTVLCKSPTCLFRVELVR